ncbi:MAG: DUF4357 domain-containing protein [Clostridia bacterium]|nr:DUF4357 domain-containing protein [Clostridia bacterium]MBR6028399.1 DUF4357 domain-containing protein [Clostridia bacterium]
MKFYIKRAKTNIDAVAEYDAGTKTITVLQGSKVSDSISQSEKFRGAKSIVKSRQGIVNANHILIKDIVFKSPSTAANFVTGISTNGRDAWKDETGRTFKQVIGD